MCLCPPPHPKFLRCNLIPKIRKCLGHKGGTLLKGTSVLPKDTSESYLTCFHVRLEREGSHSSARKRTPPDTDRQHLVLGLPSLQNSDKNYCS